MAWLAPVWVAQLPGINPDGLNLYTGAAGADGDDGCGAPATGAACGEMAQFCDRLNRFRSTSFIGWLSCCAVASLGGAGAAGSAGAICAGSTCSWAGDPAEGMLR